MTDFIERLEDYISNQSPWLPEASLHGFENMISAYSHIADELNDSPDWKKIKETCDYIRSNNGAFWMHLGAMRAASPHGAAEVEKLYRSLHENLEVIKVSEDMPVEITIDQLEFPQMHIPNSRPSSSFPAL